MRATPRSVRPRFGSATLVVALAVLVPMAHAEEETGDWPQFRGPHRDGVSSETGLLARWPAGGPPLLWRVPLGDGYSGLSVYKGRIYTMYGSDGDEIAAAIQADSGETLWTFRVDGYRKDGQGGGPRSTPTVADGVVYVLGARGKLFALNAGDGKPIWDRDLAKVYRAETPRWGVSTSPLVEGQLLIVDVGGRDGESIVAFNKNTGKEAWASFDDRAGYSAPIAITTDGVRQVLVFTARHLVAVEPAAGSVLWELPWKTSYDVNAATPVFIPPDRVFVSSGYDVGGALYRVKVTGKKIRVNQLWKTREMKNQFSSSVWVDGQLYGFDDSTLKCLDASTGERRWRERGFGHGSLLYADGHLIVLGDHGDLALVEATAEAYREQGRVELFEGKTWTPPSLAGGRLFLRDERELVALDVSE